MQKRKMFQLIGSVLLLVMVFLPCTVKQHWAEQLSLPFIKGTNKTVATCQVYSDERVTSFTYELVKADKKQFTFTFGHSLIDYTQSPFRSKTFFSSIQVNGPPLFILFQQLKIALVSFL